jgi:uncharacterized membrane protein
MKLRAFLVADGLILTGMLAATGWAWGQLPPGAPVPIHWGIDGRPDDFAPKEIGLLGVPGVALLVTALLLVAPRLEPRRENLLRSATAYRAAGIAALAPLAVVHVGTVLAAVGHPVDVAALAASGVGALLIVLGNYMGKIRSNFVFGLRTPWTLASERSWARTHRSGGRFMVGLGLAVVLATLVGLRGGALFALLFGGMVALLAVSFVYSYLVWRKDPERRPFGGKGR